MDGVVVGVASLPGIKVVRAWETVPRVLGLLGSLNISDGVASSLRLLGCLLLRRGLLLGLGSLLVVTTRLLVELAEHLAVELSLLLAELVLAEGGHLVHAGLEPSRDVRDGLSALWREHLLEGERKRGDAGSVEVGEEGLAGEHGGK